MHTKNTSVRSNDADDSLTPEALAGDVVLTTFKSSGPGGQKKNKTESSVRLQHLPTGIIVVATESRSQAQNRKTAWMRLIAKLRERLEKPKKRVPTKPSRTQKAQRLQEKKLHSRKKHLRRPPERDD
ncbi:MAG TPA: peptide chain release factor-like protein [Bacteroidetes bacterium]|nr:peptide chain release factor-like protein [Bacteroidota bacterium]